LSPATCSSPQKSPEHHETDSYQLSAYLHRLIMLSITGHHHLMILGPRGIGKSHALQEACRLWKQVQATYSPMTDLEHDYLSELHSQEVPDKIRHVQSQIRPSGLLGTIQQGSLKPGELMLAHRGVLIADEFSEWHRDSRECLRDPLEKHKVTLHRSHQHLTVLTHFLMLATSNLCACGGSLVSVAKNLRCRCLPTERNHYFSRLSGPILDRIDLLVQLDYPQNESLPPLKTFQRSQSVQQIIKTQTYLKNRYETLPGLLNTEQTEQHLQTVCLENHEIQNFFKSHEKNQSLRSRHKCARLAFTLHALEQSESHSTSLSSEYSSPPTSTPLSLKHFYEAQFYQADHFLNQRLS
jgi:magnesium chelatase family protein